MTVSRRRALLVVVGVAVLSLLGGYGLSRLVVSPRDAAVRSEPPTASAITVAVEERALTSQVVTRGEAVFDGARDVTVELAGLESPPIVTGGVPEVGATLEEGDVAFEIAGRPVLVLEGALPTYRRLGPGATGPDVRQLEEALARMGHEVGDIADETYDGATAAAVAALYADAGYPAPQAPEEDVQMLEAARDALDAASEERRMAAQALQDASRGPSDSEKLAAENAVASARRTLADAELTRDELDAADPPAAEADRRAARAAVEEARAALQLAETQQAELLAPPDVAAPAAALSAAEAREHEARENLAELERALGTPLPAQEVVFVPGLPRRVDVVGVEQGVAVDGVALSVSGTDLVVAADLSEHDRDLVEVGMPATLTSDDLELAGSVVDLRDADESVTAIIRPDDLDADTLAALRGINVRVAIPVEGTDGTALVVPVAAITAGAGEESRVEVADEQGETTLVPVEVLLAADGYAAVASDQLSAGDHVVVGR